MLLLLSYVFIQPARFSLLLQAGFFAARLTLSATRLCLIEGPNVLPLLCSGWLVQVPPSSSGFPRNWRWHFLSALLPAELRGGKGGLYWYATMAIAHCISLVLAWPKKRTILEIRGEKNAVPRVISCSIRRDQRRAKVADSRGSDLPCADRAWSSMISHVEQRSSRRESRWWFFFFGQGSRTGIKVILTTSNLAVY